MRLLEICVQSRNRMCAEVHFFCFPKAWTRPRLSGYSCSEEWTSSYFSVNAEGGAGTVRLTLNDIWAQPVTHDVIRESIQKCDSLVSLASGPPQAVQVATAVVRDDVTTWRLLRSSPFCHPGVGCTVKTDSTCTNRWCQTMT